MFCIFQIRSSEGKTRWNCTFSTVTGQMRIPIAMETDEVATKWNSDASIMFVDRVANVPLMLLKTTHKWIYIYGEYKYNAFIFWLSLSRGHKWNRCGRTYRLDPACILAVLNNESVFATFLFSFLSFSCVLFFLLYAALKMHHFHTWFVKLKCHQPLHQVKQYSK